MSQVEIKGRIQNVSLRLSENSLLMRPSNSCAQRKALRDKKKLPGGRRLSILGPFISYTKVSSSSRMWHKRMHPAKSSEHRTGTGDLGCSSEEVP